MFGNLFLKTGRFHWAFLRIPDHVASDVRECSGIPDHSRSFPNIIGKKTPFRPRKFPIIPIAPPLLKKK
jgi:hypothetical protein